MATRIRAIAANHGAQVQNVTLQQLPTRMAIGMDLAVPANASVAQAHDIATEIEGILRQAIGEDTEIETHTEPQTPHWLTSEDVDATELADIRRILQSALEQGRACKTYTTSARARPTGALSSTSTAGCRRRSPSPPRTMRLIGSSAGCARFILPSRAR